MHELLACPFLTVIFLPLRIDYCGLRPVLYNGSIFGTVNGIQTYQMNAYNSLYKLI